MVGLAGSKTNLRGMPSVAQSPFRSMILESANYPNVMHIVLTILGTLPLLKIPVHTPPMLITTHSPSFCKYPSSKLLQTLSCSFHHGGTPYIVVTLLAKRAMEQGSGLHCFHTSLYINVAWQT